MSAYPGFFFSPGDLNKKHSTIKECSTCHTAFTKPGGGCSAAGCHDPSYWETKKGIFIGHLQKERCLVCHTEHTGANDSITGVKAHEGKITGGCIDCHRMTDKHSKTNSARCEDCHTLTAWRPAKFDHAKLDDTRTCQYCHKLPEKHVKTITTCSSCHLTKAWKPATFDHKLLSKNDSCVACHALPKKHIASKGDCYLCHQTKNWKVAKIDHKALAVTSKCVECHALPKKHVKTTGRCSSCHLTKAWKPATFDHKLLSKSDSCVTCHALPKKHFMTSKECSSCHNSKKWTPANFTHIFPMQHEAGRTKNRCETCHPKSLESYDCYTGCHEHTERDVRSEHMEEGIRDYANCMKCHPTGREHEMKRRDRKKDGWFDRIRRKLDDDDDDHDDDDD